MDSLVEEVLAEIRGKLPDTPYYRPADRDEVARSAAARLKDAPNEAAIEFVLASFRILQDERSLISDILQRATSDVLRRKLTFTPEQVLELVKLVSHENRSFPYKGVLKAAESIPMTPELAEALRRLRPCITEYLGGGEMRDLHARIDILLHGPAPATSLEVQGAWSQIVFAEIAGSPQKSTWERIFSHAAESKSSEPSKKWLATADSLARELGRDAFLECGMRWLELGPSPQRPGVQLSSGETELQKGFFSGFLPETTTSACLLFSPDLLKAR